MAFTLILLTLFVVLASTYERLTITLANRYLIEYDTQITELSIRPDSLNVWHFPRLTLKVHGSLVEIADLVISLDKAFSPFQLFTNQLSLNQIDKISLAKIDVALNPAVLTEEGKNLDEQGPTLALDLNQLPEIDIGKTSLTLVGIDPARLSLVMDKLQLDETGKLNTSLRHQGNKLFALTANLTEQRWQISTSLVFDELTSFLSRLSTQELNDNALLPLLNLKQRIEDANIELTGRLNSTIDLNLKTAQLKSHHALSGAKVILGNLESLTLEPRSIDTYQNAESAQEIQNQSDRVNLEFDLIGHLADLSLSLRPFTLSIAPSPAQQKVLLNLIQDDAVKAQIAKVIQTLTAESSPEIQLSLQQPLTYSLQDKRVNWGELQLGINQSKLDAFISLNEVTLSLPHKNREANRQQLSLNGKWQFRAEHQQALSLNDLLVEPLSIEDKSIAGESFEDKPIANNSIADITLGASSLALEGRIAITANNDPLSNEITPSFSVELNINKNAQISSSLFTVKERQDSPPGQVESDFSFSNQTARLSLHNDIAVSYDQAGRLDIALPKLTMSLGPLSYRHLNPSSKSKTLEFDAEALTFSSSQPSRLRVSLTKTSNRDGDKPDLGFEFTGAPFTLSSSSIRYADINQSGQGDISKGSSSDSLITTEHIQFTSQGNTRLTLGDSQPDEAAQYKSQRSLDISLPSLSLEQTQTELSHKPFPTSSKDHYFVSLPRLVLQLESPSSVSIQFSPQLQSAVSEANHESDFQQWLKTSMLENRLSYEVDGLEINHTYIKNKRKRKQKLLHLYQASLSQTLKWNDYRLDSQEHWSIDGLEIESEHSLIPGIENQPLLQGKLQLDTELSTLLFPVKNSYSLPGDLYIDGQTRLQANYQFRQFEQANQFDLELSPKLSSLSGSINDLPFEDVDISARCHLKLKQDSKQFNSSTFTCPEMDLVAAAFNPGVLLTNLTASGDISLSHDDARLTEPSNENLIDGQKPLPADKIAANLSDAEIHLNAAGDLLGGQLLLPEFSLKLHDKSHGYLVLQGLSLEELIAIQPQVGLYADGTFDGVLPVDLINGKVSVTGGRLAARAPGGLISVSGNPAVEQMRQSQPYLDFAFSTMEHLQYTQLSSTFDMEPSGDAVLKVKVKGRGKGIERPIHLNYSQEENMLQLLKSLQVGDKLQTQIEQSMN
ncbi:YdbH domain-containing protein [Shewanella atlantica]|uniref:YdbH domain-containing protein n=1 Tax=Shewanella atlantica TaxID=271099 RepID=UPI001639DECE|nr:YdbH domain-containing protein [Shewanella atlantica]